MKKYFQSTVYVIFVIVTFIALAKSFMVYENPFDLYENPLVWLALIGLILVVALKEIVNIIAVTKVRQFQNEYNPVHWHGGHISGVGYLKVPSTYGKGFQEKEKSHNNGMINLIHGSRHFLSPSDLLITPEVGYFYFFPHYLMHTVYPFNNTNEERRSVSFNALIDEKIFNVYGN